ncbi:MAG: hypothetical protein ACFB9M_03260 [Myxococcota bacterium]
MAKRSAGLHDALTPAEDAFKRGDYVAARTLAQSVGTDESLSDARKEDRDRLMRATRVDRMTLLVGLGCIVLFGLVVLVTVLKQP